MIGKDISKPKNGVDDFTKEWFLSQESQSFSFVLLDEALLLRPSLGSALQARLRLF